MNNKPCQAVNMKCVAIAEETSKGGYCIVHQTHPFYENRRGTGLNAAALRPKDNQK